MSDLANVLRAAPPLPPGEPSKNRRQVVMLYAGIASGLVVGLLSLLPPALEQTANLTGWNRLPFAVIQIGLILGGACAYTLTHRGYYRTAAAALSVLLLAESAVFLWGNAWASPRGWISLLAALILAGLLLDKWTLGAVLGAGILIAGGGALHGYGDLNTQAQTGRWLDLGVLAVWSLALGGAAFAVKLGEQQLATAPADDGGLRHLVAMGEEMARGLFTRPDLDRLMGQIADSLVDRFPAVDNVQIYVVPSDGPQAVLRAATGPAGVALVAQDYAVDVGGLSAVGRVTLTGQPLLIRDFEQDPIHAPHPLMATMRCELAIPLLGSDGAIGALDVQSAQANIFDESALTVLRAIATQLAIVLDSLTIYEESQRSILENQALFRQSQTNLREIERLNFELTGRVWNEFLRQQADSTALTLDLDSGQVHPAAPWTDTLDAAARQARAIATTQEGRPVVSLPITVRDEVVGAMEFELDADAQLQPDTLELATAVGQRLGQAMENRRLFDESQRIAQREAIINDIGADLQTATGVDAIIQRAAHHLQETLGAQIVAIRIGSPQSLDASRSGESQA